MPFKFDSEIDAVLTELSKSISEVSLPQREDWKGLREMTNTLMANLNV